MMAASPVLSRRAILIGSGALVVAAASGFHGQNAVSPLPANLIPPGADALVLHGGGAAALAFMAQLRRTSQSALAERHIDLLTRTGFASLRPALDRASGRFLIAFVGDAEAIVIETLLGARTFQRQRHAGQVLLTARL